MNFRALHCTGSSWFYCHWLMDSPLKAKSCLPGSYHNNLVRENEQKKGVTPPPTHTHTHTTQEPEKKIKSLARCESMETEPAADRVCDSSSPRELWPWNIRTSTVLFPNVTLWTVLQTSCSKNAILNPCHPLQISLPETIGNINQCCRNWNLGKWFG